MIDFSLIDPNLLVGWLIFLGIICGAIYKGGRWLLDIKMDVGELKTQLTEMNGTVKADHEAIAWLRGRTGEPLEGHSTKKEADSP